jgi:hypothetical protein
VYLGVWSRNIVTTRILLGNFYGEAVTEP